MSDFISYSGVCIDASNWDYLLDHALEKDAVYIIRKNGSNYEAVNGATGKLLSGATSTDASTTIQAAEDELESGSGGTLVFKDDTFVGTTKVTVTVSSNTITWRGQGKDVSIIQRDGTSGDTTGVIELKGSKEFILEDITLDGNDKAAMGVDSASAQQYGQACSMKNVTIKNVDGYCIDATNATGATAAGIQDSVYTNCNFEDSTGGVYLRAQTYQFTMCHFGNLTGATDYGFKFASANSAVFTNCVWTGNAGYDLGFVANATGIEYCLFDGCWFEESTNGILYHDGAGNTPFFHHLEFRGCRFHSNHATEHEWLRFDRMRGKVVMDSRYASASGVSNVPITGSLDTTGIQVIDWRAMDGSNEPVELTITGTPKIRDYHGFELREREVEAVLAWETQQTSGNFTSSYQGFGETGYYFKAGNWQNWDEVIWQTRWNPKSGDSQAEIYNSTTGTQIGELTVSSTDAVILSEVTLTSGMDTLSSGNHTLQFRTKSTTSGPPPMIVHSRLAFKFTDKV